MARNDAKVGLTDTSNQRINSPDLSAATYRRSTTTWTATGTHAAKIRKPIYGFGLMNSQACATGAALTCKPSPYSR